VVVVAVLGCGACTPATAPASTPSVPSSPVDTAAPRGAWHVGVLGQRGTPACDGDEQRWVDVEPRIGGTPIAPLSIEELAWLDHPVVAHGRSATAPERGESVAVVAPCPTPQARSDWEFTPRGLRILRDGGRTHAYFVRDAMRPLAELTVSTREPELIVDLRNPVPVELVDVVLRIHYEGCRGKPGTRTREHEVGALGVGAGVQAAFPRRIDDDDGRGVHRAHSVQIVASGDAVTFDLDVPLAVLGAAVACPDR
jgi:hypothetical protein